MQITEFIRYIRAEKRYSEHTAVGYERDLRRFYDYLTTSSASGSAENVVDPAMVTPDDIRSWIVSLSESGLSPSSVNRMTSSLRAFFKYLRKNGLVDKDPFVRIGFQKTPVRLPAYIPESKIDDLIAGADATHDGDDLPDDIYVRKRNSLIILLFYSTGIRLAELQNIRLSDFSPDFSELKITGKGDKQRIVPVIEHTRRKIIEFIQEFNDGKICFSAEKHIFLTCKDTPVSRNEIYRIVKQELTKAGIQGKKSPHVLRHTFATHLLNDGADIKEIQELLGHNSLSATQVYTHNSITRLKEAYGKAHPRAVKKKH